MTCIANLFVWMFLIVRLYYKLVDNLSKCNYHLQCMHESYACRWFGKISRKNLFDGSNFEILYKKVIFSHSCFKLHINNHLQLSVYCVNIELFQNNSTFRMSGNIKNIVKIILVFSAWIQFMNRMKIVKHLRHCSTWINFSLIIYRKVNIRI